MTDQEKLELEARLERCRQLAREYPDSPIAETIRQLTDDLLRRLQALPKTYS